MKKYLFFILPLAALVIGCLGDTIGVQVVPRPTLPPGGIYYRAANTSDLIVQWNPSPSDTQVNFKGYFVELFNSTPDTSNIGGEDILFYPQIDSAHVPKIDTMFTFPNLAINGRYTVRVYGERNPNPAKPDSIVLSQSFSTISFTYDSRPVLAPQTILACSAGTNSVWLSWSPSASDNQVGMAGYIIRYIDPSRTNPPLVYAERSVSVPFQTSNYVSLVPVPPNPNGILPAEHAYKFWIKAIRKDSVESADSISITWSGAERIPGSLLPVKLDTGIFIGVVGYQYDIAQVPDSDKVNAYFLITQSGSNVIVKGLSTTTFVKQTKPDSSMDASFFAAPFMDADYTETQITLPVNTTLPGTEIYAKLPGNSKARIFIADSLGTYISSGNTVQIQTSFQPIETPQLQFF